MGLIELHFHDSEFSLGPSFGGESEDGGGESDAEAEFETEFPTEETGSGKAGLAVLVGLLFLILLAVAARKLGADDRGVEVEMDE